MSSQEDQRAAPRQRVLKAATIALDQGGVISCIIRNLSATGARLEVESPIGIPDEFTLVSSDHVKRRCRIIWRRAKQIGVALI